MLQVVYSRDQRIFTWLLQASTAAALIVTWLLAGTRLGERAAADRGRGGRRAIAEPDLDREVDPDLVELSDAPPAPPAPVPLHRYRARPRARRRSPRTLRRCRAPVPGRAQPAADPTTGDHAPRPRSACSRSGCAYSPKRDEARRLLDEIARAEREGRADDAAALAAQLDVM